jgi:hypothetical protein
MMLMMMKKCVKIETSHRMLLDFSGYDCLVLWAQPQLDKIVDVMYRLRYMNV